jgi:hypothetical protein
MHITASAFINDDERSLHQDYDDRLEELAPHEPISKYRHNRAGEDNGDARPKRQALEWTSFGTNDPQVGGQVVPWRQPFSVEGNNPPGSISPPGGQVLCAGISRT